MKQSSLLGPVEYQRASGLLLQWTSQTRKPPAQMKIRRCAYRLSIWTRQLTTLLNAGVPMAKALDVLCGQREDPILEEILEQVTRAVNQGTSLSGALARYPRVFSRVFVGVVQVGESTGHLTDGLDKLTDLLERESDLEERLKSAFAYPAFVLAVTVTLTLFIFYCILPAFISIFRDMHVKLPLVTRILVAITDGVRSPEVWCLAGAAVLLSYVGLRRMAATPDGALRLYQILLAVPVLGNCLRYSSLARFCWVLESVVGSGIPLLKCVQLASQSSGSPLLESDSQSLQRSIRDGEHFSEHFQRNGAIYTKLMSHMVKAGEESSGLPTIFGRLAIWFHDELDIRLALLGATIEPLLMAFVAAIVGTVVIGIFLPLYALIGDLGK